MANRLSAWCEHIIEGGWLLALILVPLFYNVHTSRVFEPDKIALLRSIALLMAVAWVVKAVNEAGTAPETSEQRRGFLPWVRHTPFVLPALLYIGATLLSTIFSVAPRISFWGSYQRLQGTFSFLAYVVVFFSVLGLLRRREQLERLLNAIVLTSIPIAIYGWIQHSGLDPLPWGGDVVTRVAANAGNPIFLAAHLIMAFFITLERLLHSFRLLMAEQEGSILDAVLTGVYIFALVVQAVAIVYTQSRGPWLGWAAGLYVFVLVGLIALRQQWPDRSPLRLPEILKALGTAVGGLVLAALPVYAVLAALRKGWRWLWLSWVIQTLLVAGFLVVFNLPQSPLSPLRELPYIGRMGQVFEVESGTGKVRVLIWEGVVELLRRDPVRAIVGYGPESMYVAYNAVYPPDLAHYEARNASPDRSHNETFDALVTTGVLGFLAYFFLFGSIFYYSLRWLGMLQGKGDRNLFLGLSLGGAAAGIVLPRLLDGSFRFAGVGTPAGFIIGVIAYLTIVTLMPARHTGGEARPEALLILALLAALVAHFVEIHFGIAIAATRTYFWALTGVLGVVGAGLLAPTEATPAPEEAHPTPRGRRRRRRKARQERAAPRPAAGGFFATLPYAAMACVILATLVYDYTTNQGRLNAAAAIFWNSIAAKVVGPGEFQPLYGILWLFLLTWLVGALVGLAAGHRRGPTDAASLAGSAVAYALATLTVWLGYGLWHASRMRWDLIRGLEGAERLSFHFVGYVVVVALLWLALALTLYLERPRPSRLWLRNGPLALGLGALLGAGAVVAILAINISLVRADVFYKQGQTADAYQQWDASITFHSKAIALAPDQDYYYLFLGRAQLEKAQRLADPAAREALIREAEKTLLRARELNPLNTDHTANLGRMYQVWAQLTSDPNLRQQRFEKALEYFRQATQLSPHNAQLFNEWGKTYELMGQVEEAEARYRQSLALDDQFHMTYWLLGQLYLARNDLTRAEEMLQKALEHNPDYVQARSALGVVYARQGRLGEALAENQKVLAAVPNDYISRRNLAYLYLQMGQAREALNQAWAARNLAPDYERQAMDDLVLEVEAALHPEHDWQALAQLLAQADAALNGGALDEAIARYQQALAQEPDLPQAWQGLATAYAQKGDYAAALAPDCYLSHRNLAVLYRAQGQLSEALAEAQTARPLAVAAEQPVLDDFIAQLRSEMAEFGRR
ncbi:MAG: tetratricopeptide repeat protein [Anaerolineae bacterium]|nr:tetratricopeptide repeat protein [Anaerolineae bacterium]